jgi:hypothetical protein
MKGKTFLDFILEASESRKKTQDFLALKTKTQLKKYFEDSPYALTIEEIEKIWKIKTKLPKIPVPPWGPGPAPMY